MGTELVLWKEKDARRELVRTKTELNLQQMRQQSMEQARLSYAQSRIHNTFNLAEHAVYRLARLDRLIGSLAEQDSMLDVTLRGVQEIVTMGVATKIRDYLE